MPISRRRFLQSSTLALAATALDWRALLAHGAVFPQPGALVLVRGTVGTFVGRGGTIGWHIDRQSVVVVDSQYPDSAQSCLDAVNARTGGRTLDFLVNTHHHGDHTGGNGVFRPATRKILAHANVPGLQRAAAERAAQSPQPGVASPPPAQTYADSLFGNTWRESVGGETMALAHFGPAHTGGDATVTFEKANVVHMGDLMFHRRHAVIDRPGGASIANWIVTLEKVTRAHDADTIYIFGHAGMNVPITGPAADLHLQRDYLTALLDFVRGEIKAGKPKELIVKSTELLKSFPDYGPLTERPLTAAYDELTA